MFGENTAKGSKRRKGGQIQEYKHQNYARTAKGLCLTETQKKPRVLAERLQGKNKARRGNSRLGYQ